MTEIRFRLDARALAGRFILSAVLSLWFTGTAFEAWSSLSSNAGESALLAAALLR